MSDPVINVPLTPQAARELRLGDVVYLRGEAVVTAGFPTHQRLVEGIAANAPPPIALQGGAFFHLGCMSRLQNGVQQPLYVNPTTSTRFNAFIPDIVRHYGITVLAGKGGLDAACIAAMREVGCVYLSIVGGAASLLTEGVREVMETGWDDLIQQFRLTRLRLDGFGPLTVAIDAHGNSLYEQLSTRAQSRLADIMTKLNEQRSMGPGS
ncbi:MAG: fumarate hydratase C-terminal domain-containing protein [Devosia sp.]